MKTLEQFKAEQMKDKEFAIEYEKVQAELVDIRHIMEGGGFLKVNSERVSDNNK